MPTSVLPIILYCILLQAFFSTTACTSVMPLEWSSMLGKTEDKPHFEPNNRPNFGQKAMVKVLEIQGQETSLDIECEDREWSSKLAEALNEIISQILHNEESSIGTVELRIKNDTGKQQCISRFFCYIKESEHQCESIEEGMETSADFNLELAADILEKRGQLDGDSSFLDHYHHSLVPPSPKKHKYASARILAEEDSNNNRTNTTTSINENKNETPLQVSNDSQGTFPPGVITLVSLVILGLLLYGLVMFLKKRRKRSLNKKHLQIEKIKFIPRTKVPSDLEFGDSKSGLKLDIPKKASLSSRNNPSGLRIFSPKTADAMNNDANQQSSVINDNIFTNLDSPKSNTGDESAASVRQTPKDIGFNIEFSMIEQDSKIKTGR